MPDFASPAIPPASNQRTTLPGDPTGEILFLALLLDPSLFETVKKRAQSTIQKHGFTRRPIEGERLHISLLGFKDSAARRAVEVGEVATSLRFPPIDITLDKAMSFKIGRRESHPFVLTSGSGLDQVREFYRLVRAAFPEENPSSNFNPHLTLLWDPKLIPEYALKKPLSWTAREFVLVRSFQGKSRYRIEGRWPLNAG